MYNILQIQTKISNNIKNKAKQSNIYTYMSYIYLYIFFIQQQIARSVLQTPTIDLFNSFPLRIVSLIIFIFIQNQCFYLFQKYILSTGATVLEPCVFTQVCRRKTNNTYILYIIFMINSYNHQLVTHGTILNPTRQYQYFTVSSHLIVYFHNN